MPTDVATPCPSGPVVVSTPLVQRYSGWPGQCESSWRKRLQVVERDGRPAEHLVVGVDRLHAGQVQQRPEQRRGVARTTARSGRGSARSGRSGRSGETAATACTRPARFPSACPGAPSSPPGSRPCRACGSCRCTGRRARRRCSSWSPSVPPVVSSRHLCRRCLLSDDCPSVCRTRTLPPLHGPWLLQSPTGAGGRSFRLDELVACFTVAPRAGARVSAWSRSGGDLENATPASGRRLHHPVRTM